MVVVRRVLTALFLILSSAVPVGVVDAESPAVPEDHVEQSKAGLKLFQEQVRPLLLQHCVGCHGGNSKKGDFDLTTRESLMASSHVGKTAADSDLMQFIRHETQPAMPFKAEKLPDDAIAAIGRWIDLGAPFDTPLVAAATELAGDAMQVTDADREFWSFRRLAPVAVPQVANDQGGPESRRPFRAGAAGGKRPARGAGGGPANPHPSRLARFARVAPCAGGCRRIRD